MCMNDFLTSLIKFSFLMLAFVGVLALILGIVLFLYPDVLFRILRWGSVGALVIGGFVLTVGAIYGYVTANKTTL